MPGYSLVPVDYQPDFVGVSLVPVDYDPFAADGPVQQARTQLASQPQPNAGFDQPPSAPQTPGSAPPLPPIVPNGGQAPSVPQPGQDLHSQYQALRPTLGVPTTESARSSYYNSITAGADDFFRSIPRGIVSGLNSAGSALARATQAEMGQDVDAPTPAQGMEILEKNVTGPLHRPEGRAGKFGASAGEFLGNPSSYVVPGSLPFKVGMAAVGGLGSEAGGQLGEGTPLEGPLRFFGGVLGGLGAAKVASASKVKPPTGAVEDVPGAGLRSAAQSGFSPAELGVIREARSIATSPQMADLAAAHGAGEPMTVRIGGRLVQYEPSMPAPYSGMSLFGENGFLMGPQAFSSNFEHNKTVLHELHRLNFSKSADGVFADLAARETNAARDFANRAVEHLP